MTHLLTHDCKPALERFATIIAEWGPTHILVPSVADTHPDHNALAVMLRLVWANLLVDDPCLWSYVVHGRSTAFFHRAQKLRQSEFEKAIKLQAIRRHKTQLKLSRKRFLKYAARSECLLKLNALEETVTDGSIRSISRHPSALHLNLKLSVSAVHVVEPTLFVLGQSMTGTLRCVNIRLPGRSFHLEMSDCATGRCLGSARYYGNVFAGELTIPTDRFSSVNSLFVKLERCSWFFDEVGWLEIPPTAPPNWIAALGRKLVERPVTS